MTNRVKKEVSMSAKGNGDDGSVELVMTEAQLKEAEDFVTEKSPEEYNTRPS